MPAVMMPKGLWHASFVVAASIVIAACSGQPVQSTASGSPFQSNAPASLVVGRSAKPADITAPGIQMPNGSIFTVSLGKYVLTIKASDWNTIVGTSQVRVLVGVEFAPDWNTKDYTYTTRNRFQYLADEISLHYHGTNFEPLSIAPGVSNGVVVEDAALYNPTYEVSKLSGLKVTIINSFVRRVVATGIFYAKPESAIIIPGRTVYFARLIFSSHSLGPAHSGMISITTNFHYDNFAPCPGQVCS